MPLWDTAVSISSTRCCFHYLANLRSLLRFLCLFLESSSAKYHVILGDSCQELAFWAIFLRDGGINNSVSLVMTGFGGKLYCLLNDACCLTKRSAENFGPMCPNEM